MLDIGTVKQGSALWWLVWIVGGFVGGFIVWSLGATTLGAWIPYLAILAPVSLTLYERTKRRGAGRRRRA